MHVGKWGNSLAVRLPAEIVAALNLKEGDEITFELSPERIFTIGRPLTREEALAGIDALARPFGPDFTFSREEANAR